MKEAIYFLSFRQLQNSYDRLKPFITRGKDSTFFKKNYCINLGETETHLYFNLRLTYPTLPNWTLFPPKRQNVCAVKKNNSNKKQKNFFFKKKRSWV